MRGSLPGSEKKSVALTTDDTQDESGMLFDKKFTCPVCDTEFSVKQVRSGKLISVGKDGDLRPRFKNIDVMKYRVMQCPVCAYADIEPFFGLISRRETEALKENPAPKNELLTHAEGVRSYEMAYRHYKAAMRSGMIRRAKCSVRATTALYTAWLIRGWRKHRESLGETVEDNEPMSKSEEYKHLKHAVNNYSEAAVSEDFPLAGMDDATFDYLMSVLYYEIGDISNCGKYLLEAMRNKALKGNLRRGAENLKELLRKDAGKKEEKETREEPEKKEKRFLDLF